MIVLPIALRGLVDRAMYRERQEERLAERGEPPAHDITDWPRDLALPSRPFAAGVPAPLVTVHVTDVAGGFGVSKAQIKAAGGDYATALLRRYHGCAYHRIVSRRVGLVTNHPLSLRTSHGNGGNRGAGWAIDCGHAEALSDAFIAAAIDSLEDLVLDTYEATGETVIVVPHRVFSKKRTADTSREVWSRIVRPAIDRLDEDWSGVARIDYMLVSGGRPVPRSWDDRALFDDRGRWLPSVTGTTKTGPDGKDSDR